MDRSAEHRLLVASARKALGREKDLVLHLNAKGHYDPKTDSYKSLPGLGTGTLDLVGMLTFNFHLFDAMIEPAAYYQNRQMKFARWIELDAKTGNAKPTKEQLMRIDLVRMRGGFAAVFHSVEEAQACIERARRGESG